MNDLSFTWNDEKNRINRQKHGISFEEAKSVFYDENARMIYDMDHSVDEDRFILLEMSSNLNLLVIVHCYREAEELIRIISARKASKPEQKQYEEFLK